MYIYALTLTQYTYELSTLLEEEQEEEEEEDERNLPLCFYPESNKLWPMNICVKDGKIPWLFAQNQSKQAEDPEVYLIARYLCSKSASHNISCGTIQGTCNSLEEGLPKTILTPFHILPCLMPS